MSILSLGISPQGASIGQGWTEITPFTVLVSFPYPGFLYPPPPPSGGRWGYLHLGESIQTLTAIFYTDDGLIGSPESACLQGAFDVLTDIFDQLVLRTNKGKTVRMD